ncbi:hypothetical protein GN330_13065 [Nitratireductor sp. CAU 1489]|uniref:Uncharacterized protein n=1 Tax=Nitratireductor arenosus TaxID=2682096 RepID=A0A844QHT6_9HYPH|nr:hypothetical protein [Nitratireductor arenosus]MVA98174.1 hypothetical protein [Nitratireductor arenosus]
MLAAALVAAGVACGGMESALAIDGDAQIRAERQRLEQEGRHTESEVLEAERRRRAFERKRQRFNLQRRKEATTPPARLEVPVMKPRQYF